MNKHIVKRSAQHALKLWRRRVPAWGFTILVTAAILWLTLAPDPLPEESLPTFPGMDKVAHACMFGGLLIAVIWDWLALSGRRLGKKRPLWAALAVAAFGGAVELVQEAMGMGRGADILDFLADCGGVALIYGAYCLAEATLSGVRVPSK